MAKGPLITRSEIRRRQQEEALRAQRESEKSYRQEEKKISNFYRKEKKNRPVTKTRTGERERQNKWNSFLMKALIIVILMLCVVFLAIAFI